MKFTENEGKQLLKLVRDIIESSYNNKEVEIPFNLKDKLVQPSGVFVTLNKHGTLRGCIGFPEPHYPLGIALVKAAKSAAFEDPRFDRLRESELKEIDIEISILTKPEKIKSDTSNIIIGRDGLIIKKGIRSGLLLPQVAEEYNWGAEEFLNQTCIKAGLPADTWKDKDAELYKFQVQIFKE